MCSVHEAAGRDPNKETLLEAGLQPEAYMYTYGETYARGTGFKGHTGPTKSLSPGGGLQDPRPWYPATERSRGSQALVPCHSQVPEKGCAHCRTQTSSTIPTL